MKILIIIIFIMEEVGHEESVQILYELRHKSVSCFYTRLRLALCANGSLRRQLRVFKC